MSVNICPSQKLVWTQAIATAREETIKPVPTIINKGRGTTVSQGPRSEMKKR